ncbi:hypothetical protein VTK26DRAFT_5677 [Humicola hyalothermophila]
MRPATLLSCILGLGHLAAASTAADEDLQPWRISELTTSSAPDRPGSSPLSVINVTISDPNEQTLVVAYCSTTWTSEEPPYNRVEPCSEVPGGKWTFEMLESDSDNPSPTTDFVLRFSLAREDETFQGSARFAVGDNMRGLCSAGGVCLFELKEENTPFLVKQTRIA